MSVDHINLINRCLLVAIVVLYVVLGLFLVRDLLPDSSITIISSGSVER